MVSRRWILFAGFAAGAVAVISSGFEKVSAAGPQAFDATAFADAQRAGKPILVAIHASWCPICKAQKPILSELLAEPKFRDLVYFVIDFDSQKDLVERFGARKQSTLIAFNGTNERDRSVGDSNRTSIEALLAKTL